MTTHTRYIKPLLVLFISLYSIAYVFLIPHYPPDVDPINFVMGLNQFDIATDRPHPPGYPLYVSAARVANDVVGRAFAYPIINLLLLVGMAISIGRVASKLNMPAVGFASILIILTHPFLLSATLSGESYIADAFFGCVLIATMLHYQYKPYFQLSYLFTIFFCIGLFRAVSSFELLPLALTAIFVFNDKQHRLKTLCLSVIAAATAIVLAYFITIYLAGGLAPYKEAAARVMGAAFRSNSMIGGAPFQHHLSMMLKLYFWLLFISVPVVIALVLLAKRSAKQKVGEYFPLAPTLLFFAWTLPPLGLYTFIYFLKPTYLLIVLPPFTLAGCYLLYRLLRSKSAFVMVVTALIGAQSALFFLGNQALPKPLHRLSYDYIGMQDGLYQKLNAILKAENSSDTVLIWDKQSTLPIYATRLIAWNGTIVVCEDESQLKPDMSRESLLLLDVSVVDPATMHWSPKQKLSDLSKTHKILRLSAESNTLTYQVF